MDPRSQAAARDRLRIDTKTDEPQINADLRRWGGRDRGACLATCRAIGLAKAEARRVPGVRPGGCRRAARRLPDCYRRGAWGSRKWAPQRGKVKTATDFPGCKLVIFCVYFGEVWDFHEANDLSKPHPSKV